MWLFPLLLLLYLKVIFPIYKMIKLQPRFTDEQQFTTFTITMVVIIVIFIVQLYLKSRRPVTQYDIDRHVKLSTSYLNETLIDCYQLRLLCLTYLKTDYVRECLLKIKIRTLLDCLQDFSYHDTLCNLQKPFQKAFRKYQFLFLKMDYVMGKRFCTTGIICDGRNFRKPFKYRVFLHQKNEIPINLFIKNALLTIYWSANSVHAR